MQVLGIPVAAEFDDYLRGILTSSGPGHPHGARRLRRPFRAKKIRNAQKEKVPFMLIAGGEDRDGGTVSFRFRDGSQRNGVPVDEAVAYVVEYVRSRNNANPTSEQ